MLSEYARFYELKSRAKSFLNGQMTSNEKLVRAAIEVFMMRDDEIPDYAKSSVQLIKDMCSTHKPQNKEDGIALASIKKMSFSDRKKLINFIEYL